MNFITYVKDFFHSNAHAHRNTKSKCVEKVLFGLNSKIEDYEADIEFNTQCSTA